MLLIKDYKKVFGPHLILDIPALQLEQPLYWLRGANGAGKTTFLKSVAGLLPFDGDIAVDNIPMRRQRRLYTTYVNHAGAEPIYPGFLTGNDLIKFYSGAKIGNIKLTEKMAGAFGMNQHLCNKVASYSSGMTKKLSLLLAFIGKPKLILLDEPFTTLDVEAVVVLNELINESVNKGIMFCISSHQPLTLPHVALVVQDKTIIKG